MNHAERLTVAERRAQHLVNLHGASIAYDVACENAAQVDGCERLVWLWVASCVFSQHGLG